MQSNPTPQDDDNEFVLASQEESEEQGSAPISHPPSQSSKANPNSKMIELTQNTQLDDKDSKEEEEEKIKGFFSKKFQDFIDIIFFGSYLRDFSRYCC